MIKKIVLAIIISFSALLFCSPTYSASLRGQIFDRVDGVARGTFNTDAPAQTTLLYTIGQATNIIIGVLGVLTAIFIIYAGFLWLTAGGNDDQIKKAKTTIRRVIIGVIIVTLAYAIIAFILGQLTQRQTRRISQSHIMHFYL